MRLIVCLLMLVLSSVNSPSMAESPEPPADQPPPPCSAPEHRQFDFWLGKWTAYSAEGQKQGTNHLHKIVGECAMQENWQSARGAFKGTSYNFYEPRRKVWHQTWVDNGGGTLLLEGGLIDGKMQLQGNRSSQEGETVIDRITWTPLDDGRVRQHWQSSADNGKTWSDVFDGFYQRDDGN